MQGKKVLIVEDEALLALTLRMIVENNGYKVVGTAKNGEAAVEAAERWRPDIILMDIMLKGSMDGVETARTITGRLETMIIYLTGNTDKNTYKMAMQTAHAGYLKKPVEEQELISLMRQGMRGAPPGHSVSNPETA